MGRASQLEEELTYLVTLHAGVQLQFQQRIFGQSFSRPVPDSVLNASKIEFPPPNLPSYPQQNMAWPETIRIFPESPTGQYEIRANGGTSVGKRLASGTRLQLPPCLPVNRSPLSVVIVDCCGYARLRCSHIL